MCKMFRTTDADKKQAAEDFQKIVAPALEKHCGAEVISLENLRGKLPLMLDQQFSTDALYIKNGRMYGLTSRIQRGSNWGTFTIRAVRDTGARTELQKHLAAIKKGSYLPELTSQSYINGTEITIGIARTADILDYIKKNKTQAKHTKPTLDGQAEFLCVSWHDMQQKGYPLKIINETKKSAT